MEKRIDYAVKCGRCFNDGLINKSEKIICPVCETDYTKKFEFQKV